MVKWAFSRKTAAFTPAGFEFDRYTTNISPIALSLDMSDTFKNQDQ
jgi:hypothetical protein